MKRFSEILGFLLLSNLGFGQSLSFQTFMNPVIPGDHPDCTLSRMGNDFYTTGSSFNITPVIYHSTDLVHWEAIAQPVSAAWSEYGNAPKGGCWGGQVVFYNDKWWHFFSRSNTMYFVTADDIRGAWTMPTKMNCPASVPGLGYDNSIFIDDNGKWYLLVKNGQVNNWIVELGENGQPAGVIYDFTWLNPAPDYPFSWAEGPVMWKYGGRYYYSFARNVAGGQKVFMSDSLTDDEAAWTNLGDFFNLNDPQATAALFQNPNHSSAAVILDDSTSWVAHPLWRNSNNNEWYGQGRQGLLNQVIYDSNGKPTADYPTNVARTAPKLPSTGIPWMVPHSDFFDSEKLNPEWSFSGYTPVSTYSLSDKSGWLRLSPRSRQANTIVKNDGEHNYAIITRLDFTAQNSTFDQAGIWIFNGLQTKYAKLYGCMDSLGNKAVGFSYNGEIYQIHDPSVENDILIWLKLVRVNHLLTGFCSVDGLNWNKVGNSIDITDLDGLQEDYNAWTGNRQGLFVKSLVAAAYFDFYIYRDAYTPILAECPANQYGTSLSRKSDGICALDNIHDGDWALYAGVEFGNDEYNMNADSVAFTASCASAGGSIEVWLDSLDSGTKIAECNIVSTGGWSTYKTFATNIISPVSGNHDVYLKFTGTGTDKLFMLKWFNFIDESHPDTSSGGLEPNRLPYDFELEQNFPNPFNPTTTIEFRLPVAGHLTVKIFDLLGREVATVFEGVKEAGNYTVNFDAGGLAGGIYLYQLKMGNSIKTRKFVFLK